MDDDANQTDRVTQPAQIGRRPVMKQVGAAVVGGVVLGATYAPPTLRSIGVQEVYAASAEPAREGSDDRGPGKGQGRGRGRGRRWGGGW